MHDGSDGGSEPLRLFFVSHSAGLYGAERSLLTLIEGLQEAGGFEIAVLLPERGPLVQELRARGIDPVIVRYRAWINHSVGVMTLPGRLARTCLNLISAIRAVRPVHRWRPDLIYSNSIGCPMGLFLAAILRRPHIWHFRELVVEQMAARYDLGERLTMALIRRWTHEILCNSNVVAQHFGIRLPGSPMTVVYNGFDFSNIAEPFPATKYDRTIAKAETIRLAIVGSVQPAKGQEDGVRALAILLSQGLPVTLEFIGDGPEDYREKLVSLAQALSVRHRMIFRGFVDDVPGELSDIAVTLMTSRFEVFGRVVVESLAYGTPVVASRSGGIPEVLQEGRTGLCYRPGNPEELAGKIAALLADRALYERLVRDGWSDATSRFSKAAYVSGIKRAMLRLLQGRQQFDEVPVANSKFRGAGKS